MLGSSLRGVMRGMPRVGWTAARGLCAGGGISYPPSKVFVGQPAPGFSAGAVVDGEITTLSLDDYKGKWTVLLWYPKDFTFVCPTEIISFSDRSDEFEAINARVIGLSTDSEESHLAWVRTPRRRGGLGYMRIPLVADLTKNIANDYGVLIKDIGIALRGLFIIDTQGVVRSMIVNDLPVGRSVDETLRLIKAFQFVEEHGEVCPADWTPGAKTMIADPDKSMDYFSTLDDEADDLLAPGPHMKVASTPAELSKLTSSGKVVVDFVAPWCGKCKQIFPLVQRLAEEHQDITFVKVDTTEEAMGEVVAELGVKALPAFHFYSGGQPTLSPVTGYKKKPLEAAVQALASA